MSLFRRKDKWCSQDEHCGWCTTKKWDEHLAEMVAARSEFIEITRDQWEGLQFELSDIKAQLAELQAGGVDVEAEEDFGESPVQDAFEKSLRDQNQTSAKWEKDWGIPMNQAGWDAKLPPVEIPEDDDWGFDTSWEDREPRDVNLADGPSGLDLGPFVIITPEERDDIKGALAFLANLNSALVDENSGLRQNMDRERLITDRPLPEERNPYDPDDNGIAYANQPVAGPTWKRLVETGEE